MFGQGKKKTLLVTERQGKRLKEARSEKKIPNNNTRIWAREGELQKEANK